MPMASNAPDLYSQAPLRVRQLADAMWEARAILGFDNDGDKTPGALIAGGGWDAFCRDFLLDMHEARKDYDDLLDELP